MAHPQNSPRGYNAFRRLDVGGSNITYNSTGLVLSAGLYLSGKSTVNLTANSTAIIATALRVGTKTTYFTSNSTGVKLGNLYISCNSTGNSAT